VPVVTLPKFFDVGFRESCPSVVPVPVRETAADVLVASLVTVRVALKAPPAFGANWRLIVAL